MKIKEIVRESEVTLKPLAGAQEVDIDGKPVGTATTPAAAQAISDLAKKGEFTPSADGAQPTSEEYDDEEEHPGHVHYNDWMNSEHAPHDDDSGDDNKVFHKAVHFLHARGVHPGDIEFHAHHMTHKFHGGMDEEQQEHDTIEQGGGDVGGDGTDDFINDIRDKSYERGQGHDGTMSPFSEGILGFGNKTPEEWAKTSPQMAKLLQFRAKAVGTPYAEQVEKRIQLLKDRLDMDAGEVAGPGGTPKDPVPPEQFDMKQLRESDNVLLEKMRTIAGLR